MFLHFILFQEMLISIIITKEWDHNFGKWL